MLLQLPQVVLREVMAVQGCRGLTGLGLQPLGGLGNQRVAHVTVVMLKPRAQLGRLVETVEHKLRRDLVIWKAMPAAGLQDELLNVAFHRRERFVAPWLHGPGARGCIRRG